MRFKKVYGQSKINSCPFCNKQATTENKQGIPVCSQHKARFLDLKCACGSWLEIKKGKYGPFCVCIECGIINLNKALELNKNIKAKEETKTKSTTYQSKSTQKHVTVTSDELDFLY
jgi:endogenous inhibitor of DNA gyrase (YacG/DUF329 family)